jgi:hypothetical protein
VIDVVDVASFLLMKNEISNRTTSALGDGSNIILTLFDNLKLDWVCF